MKLGGAKSSSESVPVGKVPASHNYMATLFSEHRGTFSKTKLYRKRNVEDNNEEDLEIVEEEGNLESVTRSSWALNLLLIFRRIFLPNGFPASVSSDYVEYQIYDTIQV